MKTKVKNILFVCKNNRFRSKVAEAYFKKINKKIKVSSAGLFQGFPMSKKTIVIAKGLGLKLKGKPRAMSNKLLTEQDIIIIVANDVPEKVFIKRYCKKIIVWKIPDAGKIEKKAIEKPIKEIIKKVDALNKQLEKGK